MKPTPKSPEFERFTEALRRIVSVPKAEIAKQEQQQKEARVKRASLGRASHAKG